MTINEQQRTRIEKFGVILEKTGFPPMAARNRLLGEIDIGEQQDAFQDLFLLLVFSILLVYIVMAAQFEFLKDPFIIMFSLPFAFTGVMLALVLTGTKLSVIAFIGGNYPGGDRGD